MNSEGLDLDFLAERTELCTGADLENLCLEVMKETSSYFIAITQ